MNWNELKNCVYHEDGSLRDIYIRNVTPDIWKRWVDYVNTNYTIEFEVGSTPRGNKIDFNAVEAYWQKSDQECPSASIYLGGIIVKTYFFDKNEIENDLTPREIKSLKDHERLLDYLKNISASLGRPVELTEENHQKSEKVLMIVDGERVIFS